MYTCMMHVYTCNKLGTMCLFIACVTMYVCLCECMRACVRACVLGCA